MDKKINRAIDRYIYVDTYVWTASASSRDGPVIFLRPKADCSPLQVREVAAKARVRPWDLPEDLQEAVCGDQTHALSAACPCGKTLPRSPALHSASMSDFLRRRASASY